MNRNNIAKLYEMQTGKSMRDMLDDIHKGLPPDVSNDEWSERIANGLDNIDLNDKMVLDAVAASIQKAEQKRHTKSPPGSGSQLSFDDLTPEWAENTGISIDGRYTKWIDAEPQHSFEYLKQRQEHAIDAANGAARALELHGLVQEFGGLPAALKRRGIDGW